MIELPEKVDESEKWKDVVGYEGLYMISNFGRVYSVRSGIVMKQHTNSTGYMRVLLYRDANKKRFFVHRLVAKSFVSGYFDGAVVDHIDRDKSNNLHSNLEWVSQRENATRGEVGRLKSGKTSNLDGVRWHKKSGMWMSQIYYNGVSYHLMSHTDEHLCANAYQDAKNAILKGRFECFMSEIVKERLSKQASLFVGVSLDKDCKKWYSQIRNNGKNHKLIRSTDEKLCSEIYSEAIDAISEDRFDDFLSDLAEAKAAGVFKNK